MRLQAWPTGKQNAITDVAGIRVGHWTNRRAGTGCTVILCESGNVAAADSRGGAPGTRELGALQPANMVQTCQGILLTGGSAFGLSAADGVVRYLEEQGAGFSTAAGPVPIVPGAVIYDLALGKGRIRPGPEEGFRAALGAKAGRVAQGNAGAGTGATVAKIAGPDSMLKGGIGTASLVGPGGLVVGALAVVNAVGIIVDPRDGSLSPAPGGDPAGSWALRPRSSAAEN